MPYSFLIPLSVVLLIVGIYYSLKKRIKIMLIFLVVALLFVLIGWYFLYDILREISILEKYILKSYSGNSEAIIMIQFVIGMTIATIEVVIIIIGLIYLLSGKFLIKSKIIISSILLIVLSISIFHWISWFNLAYLQSQNLKFSKERYSDLRERINRDTHRQMKEKNKIQ